MKRFLTVILFCVILLSLAGCSSKQIRKQDSSKDEIKSLGIDWMTEESEVNRIIEEKYGNKYSIISEKQNIINYFGEGGRETSLNWEIGGFPVKDIIFYFYIPKNEKSKYLYSTTIEYDNPSKSLYDNLKYKLDKIYNSAETTTRGNNGTKIYEAIYTDSNKNTLTIRYFNSDVFSYLSLFYTCSEVSNLVKQQRDSERAQYNDSMKDIYRENNPDL